MVPFGLSAPSLVLGLKTPSRPEVPTAALLLAPLLHALGEASNYQVRVVVPTSLAVSCTTKGGAHDPFADSVLRAAGYTPEIPESLPRPIHGRTPDGMYKLIWYAMRNYSAEFLAYRPKKSVPLFSKTAKGWCLTEPGVALAVYVRDHFAQDNRNATGIWFDGQMKLGLNERVLNKLTLNPKLGLDRQASEIRDRWHDFIAVSIRRDALHSWLVRGDAPTERQLIEWTLRKAISTFRSNGQDALLRHSRGSMTMSERQNGVAHRDSRIVSDFIEVPQGFDDNGAPEATVLVQKADVERDLHSLALDEGMERLRDAIRRTKPGAPDRYVRVFDRMCEGYSVKEIGDFEGVSRNRAASLMADTRMALRKAAKATKDAKAVLIYVRDEPYSTKEDLEEDLVTSTNLDWLLSELVTHERLETSNDGCYHITPKGLSYLSEYELGPVTKDFAQLVSL